MKVSRTEQQSIAVEVIDDIICNRCSGSCARRGDCFAREPQPSDEQRGARLRLEQHTKSFGGLLETTVHGGFDSREYLLDCTTYTFSICEKCLVEMFDQWKIPPVISCHDGPMTIEEHRQYHVDRIHRNLPYVEVADEVKATLLAWLRAPKYNWDDDWLKNVPEEMKTPRLRNAYQVLRSVSAENLRCALGDLVTEGFVTIDGDDPFDALITLKA